jgi:hypothetical protein
MTIGLKGLYTPPEPENRDIAYLEVVHNGQTYDWLAYIPRGQDVSQSLLNIEASVYADIDRKEAAWEALTPKTRTVDDLILGTQTEVPILKEEIVKADSPDYYALRRAEYPPIGDQLGAIAKGITSVEYEAIKAKIQEVKEKYPKP